MIQSFLSKFSEGLIFKIFTPDDILRLKPIVDQCKQEFLLNYSFSNGIQYPISLDGSDIISS